MLAHAVGSTLGPTGRNVILEQVVRRPDRHQGRRDRKLEGDRAATTRSRTWAPSSSTSWRRRPPTWPATAPPRPPSWRGRSSSEGPATSPRRPTRRPFARGIEKAVEAAVDELHDQDLAAGLQEGRDRPGGRRSPPTTTPTIGKHAGRRRREGRPRRRDHRRGGQDLRPRRSSFVEGMQFDKGYISPLLRHQPDDDGSHLGRRPDPASREEDQQPPRDDPLLEKVAQSGKPLLIIAEDVDGERAGDPGREQAPRRARTSARSRPPASATAARRCSPTSPILTGGTVISEDLGLKLENLRLKQLGTAKQIKVQQGQHHPDPRGRQEAADIQKRIDQLRRQIEETESEYDKEKFQERLAKLSGGVASDQRRRRDRSRHERDQGPRRRRAPCDARWRPKRDRPRRRRGLAPRDPGRREASTTPQG